jgi:hypothetical protein
MQTSLIVQAQRPGYSLPHPLSGFGNQLRLMTDDLGLLVE